MSAVHLEKNAREEETHTDALNCGFRLSKAFGAGNVSFVLPGAARIYRENPCGRCFGSEKPTTFHSLLASFTMAGKRVSGSPHFLMLIIALRALELLLDVMKTIEEVSADVSRMQALIKAPEDSRNRQMEEVFRQASEMGLGSRQIEWMTNSLRALGQMFDKLASLRKTTNVTDDTLTSILTRQKNFSNTCGKECIKDVHEDLRGKGKIIDIFQESHGSCLCWEGRCKHNCEIVIEYFVDASEYLKDEEKAMYVATAYHEYGKCGCRARL